MNIGIRYLVFVCIFISYVKDFLRESERNKS